MGQRRVERTAVMLSQPFPGVGNQTASEILGTNPANAAKMLKTHRVPSQVIRVGGRDMKFYLRSDVERLAHERSNGGSSAKPKAKPRAAKARKKAKA